MSASTIALPCARCRAPISFDGPSLCTRCRRADRFAVASTHLCVPEQYAWSAFGAIDLLAKRVGRGRAAIREAARLIDARAVVLTGPTGAGKTSLGVAMLRARLARDFDRTPLARHRFVSAVSIGVARSEHPLGDGMPPFLDEVISASGVVLIDDIATESSRYADVVTEVVVARHECSRPIWITTWATQTELAARYGGGVQRRLFEGASVIDLGEAPR